MPDTQPNLPNIQIITPIDYSMTDIISTLILPVNGRVEVK
jgi:hypothetical protein